MWSSAYRKNNSEKDKLRSRRRLCAYRLIPVASLFILASLIFGCTGAPKDKNASSTGGSGPKSIGNANAGTPAASSHTDAIDIKEPECYSVAMTISVQAITSEAPAPMATEQFTLARFDSDRRWSFVLPTPLGQVVYLEKSGLRYLVFFERKQYVELAPNTLDLQLSSTFGPGAVAGQLKSRAQFEQLGLEPVNGRTALKYRVTGAGEAAARADGVIFVDQETGLPLRSEINIALPAGAKSRMIVEARDVQLNPDRTQFDVPAGMKKVTPQEAKQQIESFASALRPFADALSGKQPAPVAEANRPPANTNAGRRAR